MEKREKRLKMMNGITKTSVVVCAYTERRWEDTLEAVGSLLNSEHSPLEVVLVVDHNPTLFEQFSEYFQAEPRVLVIENRYLQGLSGARNAGISVSQGDYVCFLDDDAIADPDWLSRLSTWCEEDENILGVGSKVTPIWVDGKVSWFPEEFNWTVGCSYTGLPEVPAEVRNPFGGGMLIRKNVFEQVGGFRTGTGRVGEVPLGCEETELCIRARQANPDMRFMYDPYAKISHKVPGKRLTWSYFFSRCFNEGISKALISRLVGAEESLSAEKSYTLLILPRGVAKGVADFLFRFDTGGLGKAVAIVLGLFTTGIGYLVGRAKFNRKIAETRAVIGEITPILD